MDLAHYYEVRNIREGIASRHAGWLMDQFAEGEEHICCNVWINGDTNTARAKIIGDIIVGMLFSSGCYGQFKTYKRVRQNACLLVFWVEKMTETEREKNLSLEDSDSSDDEN